MANDANPIEVCLEVGKSRTFALALDWPGWCRGGRDEAAALHALYDYGPRYARALQTARLQFRAPSEASALVVVERIPGNTTTDFGAPNVSLPRDSEPVDPAELQRWQELLQACWLTFDSAMQAATGQTLRKGPRGGGRGTEQLLDHVLESHYGYLRRIAWRERELQEQGQDVALRLAAITHATEQALAFAVSDQMPKAGPRGGTFWTPRYFVRRSAWHILDHTWEMEDKLEP